MTRTEAEELEFCERCEKDAIEDIIYLIDNGKDDAVNRILNACRARSDMHNQALERVRKELSFIRDELLRQMNEQNH